MIHDKSPRNPDVSAKAVHPLMRDLPESMMPYYTTALPNASITLYKGALEIPSKDRTVRGNGEVTLTFTQGPKIRFRIADIGLTGIGILLSGELGKGRLNLCDRAETVQVFSTGFGDDLTGVLDGDALVGSAKPISKLFFHLLNFTDVFGSPVYSTLDRASVAGRIRIEVNEWKVVLDPVPGWKELKDALGAGGGHGITHIAMVQRRNGELFAHEDVEPLLEALFNFFSFCMGRWCAPVLIIEFDADGHLFREDWTTRLTTSWRYVSSWFSGVHAEIIPSLFDGFWKRWQEPNWRDALQRSMWWYISANIQAGGIDGGIILSQVALELLAWVLLIEEGHVISAKGFEDLPAADKLRLLLDRMRLPLEVPPQLKELASFDTKHKVTYAAFKFVEVRNALVHPKNRASISDSTNLLVECWELGLWYTELAILFACGYSGKYVNRNVAKFQGEVQQVPWSK